MLFSVGAIEILAVLFIGVTTFALFARRENRYRLMVVTLACASLAAIVTPADVLSMLLLFVAFLATFAFGSKYHLNPPQSVG